MPSETSAVNAAYIEARMKQFKLVDMREQYRELIRVASEQSMTYEDFPDHAVTSGGNRKETPTG